MAAPALVASSTSSTRDSRPCSPAGIPGKRGARFQPMPTSKARSRLETFCGVLVTSNQPGEGVHANVGDERLRHRHDYTLVCEVPRIRTARLDPGRATDRARALFCVLRLR